MRLAFGVTWRVALILIAANILIASLWSFGAFGQGGYIQNGTLVLGVRVPAMNNPLDCAIYRFAVAIDTLSGDVLQEC